MSKWMALTAAAVLLTLPSEPSAQAANPSDGAPAQRAMTMCGLTASTATSFREQVGASREYVQADAGSRFDLFNPINGTRQWVFTRPTEAAYPAATCREFVDRDGATYSQRGMLCDASRAACDRLQAEFAELDEQMTAAIRDGR